VKSGKRNATSMLKVFEALRSRPISNLKEIALRTGLSFVTVAKAVEGLVAYGILREMTGGMRGRIFAYHRYTEILNEGAEPL
jgi:predicted transcriptional regulator